MSRKCSVCGAPVVTTLPPDGDARPLCPPCLERRLAGVPAVRPPGCLIGKFSPVDHRSVGEQVGPLKSPSDEVANSPRTEDTA